VWHEEHWKFKFLIKFSVVAAIFWFTDISFFSVVLSGDAVRLHEGGESVPCMKLGFVYSSRAPRGASSYLGLNLLTSSDGWLSTGLAEE